MIDKLQSLKGKTKVNFYQNSSNFYDELKIRRQSDAFPFEEDPFSKRAESFSKSVH